MFENRLTLTVYEKSLQYFGCCRQGIPSAVIKNETCESSLMLFAYVSSNCSDLGDGCCPRYCCFYVNQCDWRQAAGLTGSRHKDRQILTVNMQTLYIQYLQDLSSGSAVVKANYGLCIDFKNAPHTILWRFPWKACRINPACYMQKNNKKKQAPYF